MNRHSLSLIAVGLILVILVSAFIMYELGFLRSSAPPKYSVVFSESGLEPGTQWNVTFNGQTLSSSGGTIIFANVSNGQYSWSLTPPSGYMVSESAGTVTISGADFVKNIAFTAAFPSVLWKRSLGNFAVALAVDDGKVFIIDKTKGDINCYDSQSGRSLWNCSPPGSQVSVLKVSEGKVYAAANDNHVICLDEATGEFQWSFQGIYSDIPRHTYAPSIIAKGDRVFSITDAISAHNATTGELLWQAWHPQNSVGKIIEPALTWPGGWLAGFPLDGDPFDGDSVYATTDSGNGSAMYFFKLNTARANGTVLWRSDATWDNFVPEVRMYPIALATSQSQVIIEIIKNNGAISPKLLSLDSNTSKERWNITVGSTIYNPVVYNDLLLFGAADGNLYALHLADGTIAWKTKVDTQDLFSFVRDYNYYARTSPVQIDSQNQRLFWSFGIYQIGASDNHTATLCSLDVANGNVTWTKQIENSWLDSDSFASLVVNNDRVFMTGSNALWIFNASNGNFIQRQQFDNYVSRPVVWGNTTFVAADLWLFAYV